MDKTKIEWCNSTWNPVTGCENDCPYCYARRIANRFSGHGDRWDDSENYILDEKIYAPEAEKSEPYPYGFVPTLHRYRLDEYLNKKGRTIFVCSMADLFGEWVPEEWIMEVFNSCKAAPQHRYIFLTKNPGRYIELDEKGILPDADNMWYGTTATGPDDIISWSVRFNMFVSIEPLLEDFGTEGEYPEGVKWIVIGAETGRRKDKVAPEKSWVDNICDFAAERHTPIFMKESLLPIVGEENMRREFPWG